MYSQRTISPSFDTSNQLPLSTDKARDWVNPHEAQSTSHRDFAEGDMFDINSDYASYEEFQATDLLRIFNNIQYDLGFS